MQAEHDDGDAFSNQPKGLTYDGEREVLARGGYDRHMDITQALMGPHEWGYRDPVEGGWIDDSTPFAAAELIAYLRDQVEVHRAVNRHWEARHRMRQQAQDELATAP